MRNIASIQIVKDLKPIEGADSIELARILGWNLVVKKGEFQVGDCCVYFEVDAFLPVNDVRYEFLRKSSYRNNEFMGEGYRIKTVKLKGCVSQGLALPVSMFPELKAYQVGADVSEKLGVVKWEIPEMTGPAANHNGEKPYGIPTTDEIRVQSRDALRQALLGMPYYISTKMDGSSCTIYNVNGHIGVCSRSFDLKDDHTSIMWKTFHRNGHIEKMKDLENIVIQGEFCGPRIQKNRLGLKGYEFYVFNIFKYSATGEMDLLGVDDMLAVCEEYGFKSVPIEEIGEEFNYTLEQLLELAKGKYPNGNEKEGIVVRPRYPFYTKLLGKDLSFKVLNNDYLLKEEG